MYLNGLNVLESESLTETVEKTIHLNWKQRLMSWPWRPWVHTKVMYTEVPSDKVIVLGDTLICHPSMARMIRAELKAQSNFSAPPGLQ